MNAKKYCKEKVKAKVEELKEMGLSKKYNHPGIYCIMINNKIVYIGKSLNMLERVAQHILEINAKEPEGNKYKVLKTAHQNCFVAFDVLYTSKKKDEEDIKEEIGRVEGLYIRQYMPVLNYQIPREDDWHKYTVNKIAKTITLKQILGEDYAK